MSAEQLKTTRNIPDQGGVVRLVAVCQASHCIFTPQKHRQRLWQLALLLQQPSIVDRRVDVAGVVPAVEGLTNAQRFIVGLLCFVVEREVLVAAR